MVKIKNLIDLRQTPEYANFISKIGWKVVNLKDTYVFIKKLHLLPFSFIKILRAKKIIQVTELKKYHPLIIRQQPFILESQDKPGFQAVCKPRSAGLKDKPGFCLDKFPLIPTKTIWLDLTKSQNQLLKAMHPKTRYNIKKYRVSNIEYRIVPGHQITNNQLTDFYNLWSKNKPFNFLFKPSFKELKYLIESFNNKCFFVFAYCHPELDSGSIFNRFRVKPGMAEKELLASCLILTSPNMSFYWHNCSSQEGKTRFAPTICVWNAILESKKRGLKVFDFEGIWDSRLPKVNQGWQGFSRFKKSFGGEEIKFY